MTQPDPTPTAPDVVERLRAAAVMNRNGYAYDEATFAESAAEIERLRAEVRDFRHAAGVANMAAEALRAEVAELRGVAKQLSNDVRDADDDANDLREEVRLAYAHGVTAGGHNERTRLEPDLATLRARVAELQDCAEDWSRQANNLLAENVSLSARVAETRGQLQVMVHWIDELAEGGGLDQAASLRADCLEAINGPGREPTPDPRDARIAELTTDLALSQDATLGHNHRAVAAEARIAELEAALRELMRWADHYELVSAYPVPGITLAVSQARRALGEETGRG